MSIFEYVDSDISNAEIDLKYRGDHDKQFQFVKNCLVALDQEVDDLKAQKSVEAGTEAVDALQSQNKDLRNQIEAAFDKIKELEAKFDSFIPDEDSDSIKPDLFEESGVDHVVEKEPEVVEESKSKKK